MQPKLDKQGLTLLEVMVSAAIGGFVLYALSSGVVYSLQAQNTVALKNEALSFDALARLLLLSPENCRLVLGAGANGEPRFGPTDLPAAGAAENTHFTIPRLTLGRQTLETGSSYGRLKVRSMALEIQPPLRPNEYLASLQVKFERNSNQFGLASETALPLLLKLRPDSASSVIDSCYGAGGGDAGDDPFQPATACGALGGRWLAGQYMVNPRCNLTADVRLREDEGPDGIYELNGRSTRNGERVTECYYQKPSEAIVRTYACRGLTNNRQGPRCVFKTDIKKWVIQNFSSDGVPGIVKETCTKGVLYTLNTGSAMILEHDENLDVAYGRPLYPDQRIDRLGIVNRCQYISDGDFWKPCGNPTDPQRAIAGDKEACIFVTKVKLTGDNTLARVRDYNEACAAARAANPPNQPGTTPGNGGGATALRVPVGGGNSGGSYGGTGSGATLPGQSDPGTNSPADDQYGMPFSGSSACELIDPNQYTGWVNVTSLRKFAASGSATNPLAKITEATGFPCFQVEVNPAMPTLEGIGAISNMGPDEDLRLNPTKVAQCFHAARDASDAGENRDARIACDNSAVDLTGDPSDPDYAGPVLNKGACWYVRNTKVAGYSPSQAYTGWLQLTKDLPENKFKHKLVGGVWALEPVDNAKINGIPCRSYVAGDVRAGVRKHE
ncbi:MAG: type II secretion system protein J [Bacteriovoracia bacterium]